MSAGPYGVEGGAAGRRAALQGAAVQVDPGFTVLAFQQLKLNCDEPLSNFGFNFNSRRYIAVATTREASVLLRTVEQLANTGLLFCKTPTHAWDAGSGVG